MASDLTDFLNELSSKKGKNDFTVHSGSDLQLDSHIPYGFATRLPSLDLSIGRPGYPAGRVIELFGFEGAGKSSVSLSALASAQRMNAVCLLIDTERAFDPSWARLQGVDPSDLVVANADTIEDIFLVADKAIEAKLKTDRATDPFLIVVDSVTAVPSSESSVKDFGEVQRLGTDARAIRTGMRKLNPILSKEKATILFVNHNISNANAMPFAKQSTSAGGHAIKYFASLRLEMIRAGTVKYEKGGDSYRGGMKVKIKVEKNKVSSTGRMEVECELLNTGFDIATNLFDALISIGEIKQINQKTFTFQIPNKEEVIQLTRAEWPKFITEYATDVDKVYQWFILKAQQKGFLKPYE